MRIFDTFGRRQTTDHLRRRPFCLFKIFHCAVILTVITMCIFLGGRTKNIEIHRNVLLSDSGERNGSNNASDNFKRRLRENIEKFIKQERLLPLKTMFEDAKRKGLETDRRMNWNNNTQPLPLEDLNELNYKPRVLLLAIVSSAPKRQDRRNAIRQAWWKKCFGKVKCVFFTDGLQIKQTRKTALLTEHHTFRDIKFSPTEDQTMILGERFLYQIMWAKAKFHFQYFLRLDDDYFVCMDRLINELPFRPKKNLSWGAYHCSHKELVYMDESWALFSEDVIQTFLAQNLSSMMCHGFGDQTFSMWINATKIRLIDFNDYRLHFYPPAGKLTRFFQITAVCNHFIGIHGSYPGLMKYLWLNNNDNGPKDIIKPPLLNNTCPFTKVFNVYKFKRIYRLEPKPCLERPRWSHSGLTSWEGMENVQFN